MRYAWFARANELMLDLDNKQAADKLRPAMTPVPSSTKGHFHVLFTLRYNLLSPVHHAQLAIHAGSDPLREAANLDRARKGAELPIALFRKDKPKRWRKPDLTCNCPWEIRNKKTGKMERLHACVCIRTLRGHQYQAALRSNPKRISQRELREILSGRISL